VIEYQRESGKAQATMRATAYHAQHLLGILGPSKSLSSITLADTTAYLRARLAEGASRHTVAKELRTLTQAMRRAAKLGAYVAQVDPRHFVPDELGKVYTPRARWLTREEYQALLVELGRADGRRRNDRRDYVIAWCNLGLRKSELFSIEPGDYDAVRQRLRVRGTKTDDADRLVPVNADAAEVLRRRCQRGVPFPPWSVGTCTRDLAAACRRAGIEPATPNDLRRTFCSWLCQAGVPERVCAELMGHRSTVMVRSVYGHLDQVSMAAAVERIGAVTGGVTGGVTTEGVENTR